MSELKSVTPKFLTREVAEIACRQIEELIGSQFGDRFKRKSCHIVVFVPSMSEEEGGSYAICPRVLFEHTVGDRSIWTGEYDDIAKGKGLQLWDDRNDDRTNIQPHLLFSGDTVYWGAVKRQGIVVACSGIQPWFDKMIASMVADMLIALAYDAWMNSDDKNQGADFLT